MSRRVVRVLLSAFLAALFTVGPCAAAGASSARASSGTCQGAKSCNPIKHIVFLIKENRSFDSMFGRFPGANGATTYLDSSGHRRPLGHLPDEITVDIRHTPRSFTIAYLNGGMNGFADEPSSLQRNPFTGRQQLMSVAQFHEPDIPNYWAYARRFTLADRFFSTVPSASFPNHLVTVAANNHSVMDNPLPEYRFNTGWGCDAPRDSVVQVGPADPGRSSFVYPCFNFQTLTDRLDQSHVSWRYYAPSYGQPGYQWSTLDAIKHIRFGPDWTHKVLNVTRFQKDAARGTLPSVSWLVPPAGVSDHPLERGMCLGENWTVQQINAVMSNRRAWDHTLVVLVWDDWGGLFDHVKPPKDPVTGMPYGFRVPAIIISPYARRGYVDHTFYSFPSMLKFAEQTFGVPPVNGHDASAPSLSTALDFSQRPTAPFTLKQRSCPLLIPRSIQKVRDAAVALVPLAGLGGLFLVTSSAAIVGRRPRFVRKILRVTPLVQILCALGFVGYLIWVVFFLTTHILLT